jgi:hypothetical protein
LSGRAVIALRFERYFAIEAEKRMKAGINQHSSPESKITQGSQDKSAEQAARVGAMATNYLSHLSVTFRPRARG